MDHKQHAAIERQESAGYLSLAVRTDDFSCLVIGGGRVGTRKVVKLVRAGAKVTVLSPEISPRLTLLANKNLITWRRQTYTADALAGFRLVVAATADVALNLQIGRDAEARGILACVASSATKTQVLFPAICQTPQATIAVHTRGRNCRRAKHIRDRIAQFLAPNTESPHWQTWRLRFDQPSTSRRPRITNKSNPHGGKVYIVGAGPGAPDLITLRGLRALRAADVVLLDQLLPDGFLADLGVKLQDKLVRAVADGRRHWPQIRINRYMAAAARAGWTVVRLKNGDPCIFGRGDDELNYLANQGITCEIIPGLSSATAVPTAVGLPLTQHGRGRSFAVATARLEGGQVAAAFPKADSLVILMGVAVIEQVVAKLLADDWPTDTPAAVVERGTQAGQRQFHGQLAELPELTRRNGVESPALLIIGEAASTPSPADAKFIPVLLKPAGLPRHSALFGRRRLSGRTTPSDSQPAVASNDLDRH